MAIEVGNIFEEKFSYTQVQVEQFIALTGDNNPVHHDVEYASGTIFGKPIIHGFLSASIFSKILGMNLPGPGTIYMNQSMSFKRPMYAGVEYACKVEVLEANKPKYKLKTIITDPDGKITIEGEADVMNKDVE